MQNLKLFILSTVLAFVIFACQNKGKTNNTGKENISVIEAIKFDTIFDNKQVKLYHLKNGNQMSASFTNYGARIIGLEVPGKNGQTTDVVVGLGSIREYLETKDRYYGATIGRYGNRIANGKFIIDGITYQGLQNNGPNMLHGGTKGFHDVVWDAKQLNDSTLQFNYFSKDLEMSFPGNLNVKVIYQLTSKNELKISYEASTDKKTIINLTNHAFFNLNGEGSGSILNHQLQIFADKYTPVDSTLIPTGELADVKNTPLDFNNLEIIGKRIESNNTQIIYGKGYDHNYVLNNSGNTKHAAKVIADKTGIIMDVYTDEPGLQFYSGNFMKGLNVYKNGVKDDFRTAFCLETQHFPDSPNHSNFPSTLLNPKEIYKSVSSYKFSSTNK